MPGMIGSLGELLVEFVCTQKNTHNREPAAYRGPFASGAPGIFIDQAARVGASTIFVGAVGDDAFGTVLLDRFARVGVRRDLIATVPGVPTGSAFVAYNDDGSRDFVFNIAHSAAARFPTGPAVIARLLDAGITIFHISGSSLGNPEMAGAALDVARTLRGRGVEISFDPNIRKELIADPSYMDVVRELLGMAGFALPSVEDADLLFPGEGFESFAPRLRAGGAHHVVLKRGALGCMGLGPDGRIVTLPAHAVEVVDPTGAGDCFCATLVALTASGRFDFAAAIAHANAAGALAVGRIGPMEGNSTLAEIEAFLGARS